MYNNSTPRYKVKKIENKSDISKKTDEAVWKLIPVSPAKNQHLPSNAVALGEHRRAGKKLQQATRADTKTGRTGKRRWHFTCITPSPSLAHLGARRDPVSCDLTPQEKGKQGNLCHHHGHPHDSPLRSLKAFAEVDVAAPESMLLCRLPRKVVPLHFPREELLPTAQPCGQSSCHLPSPVPYNSATNFSVEVPHHRHHAGMLILGFQPLEL